MRVVITGSSNKFGKEIYQLAEKMRESGSYVVEDSRFHLLSEEQGRRDFMKVILDCDKLLVYNKNGYIGFHTQLEIIMAEVIGVRVEYLFSHPEEET